MALCIRSWRKKVIRSQKKEWLCEWSGLEYTKILSFTQTAGQELLSAKLDEGPRVESKFKTLLPRH
jgi:hypothetical protein